MHSKEFAKRPVRVFLSYSHVDAEVARPIYEFLAALDGDDAWFDEHSLDAGAPIARTLQGAIPRCRALVLLLSEQSRRSNWVQREYNLAANQEAKYRDFRLIVLKIDDHPLPTEMDTDKCLQLIGGKLDVKSAVALLNALSPNGPLAPADMLRPVYLVRGWRESEAPLAAEIVGELFVAGLQPIGDALDQQFFDLKRVQKIIAGCRALVAIIPNRGDEPSKYKYFLDEIELALAVGLPVLALLDQGARPVLDSCVRVEELSALPGGPRERTQDIREAIADFAERLPEPPRPAKAFLGHSFDSTTRERFTRFRRVFERMSGLYCVLGEDIHADIVREKIIHDIRRAEDAIIDLTAQRPNTFIEAGIALGTGTPLRLLAGGERHGPPFMVAAMQPATYEDELKLLIHAHNLGHHFRRLVYAP